MDTIEGAIIIAYSNAEEAKLLEVPRTSHCTGQIRNFPGSLSCRQTLNTSSCRFFWGQIASVGTIDGVVKRKSERLEIGAFTSWETTRNTNLWRRFVKHFRNKHKLHKGDRSAMVLKCSKCHKIYVKMEDFFEHSFRLVDSGYFCRLCRYPFSALHHNTVSKHLYQNHRSLIVDNNYQMHVVSFADYFSATADKSGPETVPENITTKKDMLCDFERFIENGDAASGSCGADLRPSPVVRNCDSGDDLSTKICIESFSYKMNKYSVLAGISDSDKFDTTAKQFNCSKCPRVYCSKKALKQHILFSHFDRKCLSCSKTIRYNYKSMYRCHDCFAENRKEGAVVDIISSKTTISEVFPPSAGTSGPSTMAQQVDVKPAKRAKLMSNLELPSLTGDGAALNYAGSGYCTKPVSSFGTNGIKEETDMIENYCQIAGFPRIDEDADSCGESSSGGAVGSLLPSGGMVKMEEMSSAGFCDLKEVKSEPLDEASSISNDFAKDEFKADAI